MQEIQIARPVLRSRHRISRKRTVGLPAVHIAGGALTGGLTAGGLGAAGGAAGAGVSVKLASELTEIAQSIKDAGLTGNKNVDLGYVDNRWMARSYRWCFSLGTYATRPDTCRNTVCDHCGWGGCGRCGTGTESKYRAVLGRWWD